MDLHLPTESLERYKSASQRARIGTEAWGALNFFCSALQLPKTQRRATQRGRRRLHLS
jgi:Dam-replacing family